MKFDDLDRKILALLAKDGRMSNAEIARLVSAGERTVTNRVKSLIENEVVNIIGVINGEAFGYGVTADIMCEAEASRIEEVANDLGRSERTVRRLLEKVKTRLQSRLDEFAE